MLGDIEIVEDTAPQMGPVSAWSYSALKTFEECPYRLYLSRVKKFKEEKAAAAERGTLIHDLAEKYVRSEIETLPKELSKFTREFKELRLKYATGLVVVEEDWGVDIDWQPTGWFADDVWGRMKLDVFEFYDEDRTSARLIDHKTGKKIGNEIAHSGQAQQYAIGSFMRYPDLSYIDVEFFYLDHGTKLKKNYTRDRAMLFLPKLHERALAMTTATEFQPKPSRFTCKWCPHAKSDNCEWADK